MQVTFDAGEIESLVAKTVRETILQMQRVQDSMGGQLAFDERTAARLLGLESHQLRDERLRGRIAASRIVGSRVRYQRADLQAYLDRGRIDARDV